MFVSPAYAQGTGGFGGLGGMESLLPLVLIFVVFYFLLIRPQQKKAKAHREMLGTLRRGDRIVTGGGLIGQIIRVVSDNELIVEISKDIKVRVMRSMVSDVIAKTEPAGRKAENDDYDDDDEDDYDDEDDDRDDDKDKDDDGDEAAEDGKAAEEEEQKPRAKRRRRARRSR